MIRFPSTIQEAREAEGRIRAGGTDELELYKRGLVGGPVVDLRDVPGLEAIRETADGGLRIGARVPLARVAEHPAVNAHWSAVAVAAAESATPQIRARATIAGSLLQEVRCWYFRNPEFFCLKKGGSTCYAREGDHSAHSVVDRSTCVAPHPSTLACALWALEARIEVHGPRGRELRDIPGLLGDGTDPRRTNAIEPGEVVTHIMLGRPAGGTRSAYLRVIHRARAEWPLVEAAVRVRLEGRRLRDVVVVGGALAVRPLRFDAATQALDGLEPTDPQVDDILDRLVLPAPELPKSAFKAELAGAAFRGALERALSGAPSRAPDPAPDPEGIEGTEGTEPGPREAGASEVGTSSEEAEAP